MSTSTSKGRGSRGEGKEGEQLLVLLLGGRGKKASAGADDNEGVEVVVVVVVVVSAFALASVSCRSSLRDFSAGPPSPPTGTSSSPIPFVSSTVVVRIQDTKRGKAAKKLTGSCGEEGLQKRLLDTTSFYFCRLSFSLGIYIYHSYKAGRIAPTYSSSSHNVRFNTDLLATKINKYLGFLSSD